MGFPARGMQPFPRRRLKGSRDPWGKGQATDRQKVALPFPPRSAYLSAKGQATHMETPILSSGFSVSADFIFGTAVFDFGTATLQNGTDTVYGIAP